MRALDHCIGGNGKLISFWNMSDRTIIPNTEINKVLIAFLYCEVSPYKIKLTRTHFICTPKNKGQTFVYPTFE